MKYIILFLSIVCMAACSKDDRLMYKEEPRIYFTKFVLGESNSDSVVYSFRFKGDAIVTDTLYMNMRIMGSAVNRDRVINLLVDSGSTAKPGYHFKFGPLVMPANEYQARLPVYIYRVPGLKDSLVDLIVEVAESADFKPGYDDYSRNSKLDRLHYKISFTDRLTKPQRWDGFWVTYFGVYSAKKFQFIIDVTGKVEWERVAYPQDINYMMQQVRDALRAYEETHGSPLLDENGNEITIPQS